MNEEKPELKKSIKDFMEEFADIKREGQRLVQQKSIGDGDLRAFYEKASSFLENSFKYKGINEYLKRFNNQSVSGEKHGDVPRYNKGRKSELSKKLVFLEKIKKEVTISSIIRGKKGYGKNISVKEKKNFVLARLYEINDGELYPLILIFELNDIPYRDAEDVSEFADYLAYYKYIWNMPFKDLDKPDGVSGVRITYTGQEYVEEEANDYLYQLNK